MSDSDWAKKTVKKFQDDESREREKNAAFVEQQRIKKEFADQLWNQLRVSLNGKCNEINFEARRQLITVEIPAPENLQLIRNEPTTKRVAIIFKPQTMEFMISIFGQTAADLMSITVAVDKELGTGYLAEITQSRLKRWQPSEVVDFMIEEVLRLVQ